ncbi:MAG: hypothetical protein ACLFWB_03385 [Armatimonadota bacterium]
MLEAVRLTICLGAGRCSQYGQQECNYQYDGPAHDGDIAPMSARFILDTGSQWMDLGERTLDMTIEHILEQTPMLSPDVSEDVVGQWLWEDNTEALTAYRRALEDAEIIPPKLAVRVCGARPFWFPDCPLEALMGDALNPLASARYVPEPDESLSPHVGRHVPPVGVWRVAPVSLLPRHVLPAERQAASEYDAIIRRRLPSIELADMRYAASPNRLQAQLERIAEQTVQALHVIGEADGEKPRLLLPQGRISAREFAHSLSDAGFSELQLVFLSTPGSATGACQFAQRLMQYLPVSAAITYQGEPTVKSGILPFVERFYASLGTSKPVDVAVARARTYLRESSQASTADVLAPVLYMRADREPVAIRPGDAIVESILAASDALTTAREIFEDPAIMRLVSNIPAILAQTHNRLSAICSEQIESIREARRDEARLMRHQISETDTSYTFSGAIAEQLQKVLRLPPSPSTGREGIRPTGPVEVDWKLVLGRAAGSAAVDIHQPPGPRRCLSSRDTIVVARIATPEEVPDDGHLLMKQEFNDDLEQDHQPDTAVIDVRSWVPFVVSGPEPNTPARQFFEQLTRDIASAAAGLIRELLTFHFRETLGRDDYASMPPGLDLTRLLHSGLLAVGVRLEDATPEHHRDRPWPDFTYLFHSPDEDAWVLVVLRPSADAELADEDRAYLQDFCEREYGRGRNLHVIYMDPWPVSGVREWEPGESFASPSRPSWVWDQLVRTMDESRQQALQRLWEWWIGALPPEGENG